MYIGPPYQLMPFIITAAVVIVTTTLILLVNLYAPLALTH